MAENALVNAETDYAKARVQLLYSTGTMLETYGITIQQAKAGKGNSSPIAADSAQPTAP